MRLSFAVMRQQILSGASMGSIAGKFCRLLFTAAFILPLLFPFSSPLLESAAAYDLTVENTGSGGGDINGTVTCTMAALGDCTTPLLNGTAVTLTANPDWKSIFAGWGTPCSDTGLCDFTLDAPTVITVTFSPNLQTRVLGMNITEYTTLTEAYANAGNGSTIAAHVYSFDEELILTRPIFTRLYGGREGLEYLTAAGFSTLQRPLVVQQGYLVVGAMIVSALEVQQGIVEIDSLIIQ